MSVRLTTLGGEVKDLSFFRGTIGDYASRSGVALDERVTVSRNGDTATPETPVQDQDLVIVAPKISNG